MRYPVYIHPGDERHAFGATVPDFPGCFAATDDEADLTAAIQEAIELYCEGEGLELPKPSKLADLIHSGRHQGGAWVLVDVDTSRIDRRARRVNISMPVNLLSQIDRRAGEMHLSRSAFLAMAAEEKLRQSPR